MLLLKNMQWQKYLALLNWQGQKITFEDFNNLKSKEIKCIEDLNMYITNPQVKKYVLDYKTWWKTAENQIKICQDKSIKLTWPGDENYPQLLKFYKNAPTLLSYKGSPSWNDNFTLCVVGSRKSHHETLMWMDHYLSPFLFKHKICLISGGARGIDQKGHSLALRTKKPTLCFLPCGISHFYPPSLEDWIQPIIENQGALVSPFPPEHQIRKSFFHYRNSLMVRMSHLVLIIQAEQKSGSMLTARLASLYGVTLCALPGSVMNPLFSGNLDLINNGAFMIRDQIDLEALYYSQNYSNPI